MTCPRPRVSLRRAAQARSVAFLCPSLPAPNGREVASRWQEADTAEAARPTGPGTRQERMQLGGGPGKILTFWLLKPNSMKATTPDGENPSHQAFHKYLKAPD